MIWYRFLGTIFLLIIERKSEARKMYKNYNALFVAHKQEWQSIAYQILNGENVNSTGEIVQQGDFAYMIVENNQQLTIYPLNSGKTINVTKHQHQILMRDFRDKCTVYKVIDSTISVYHRMTEPFNNCILLIKRSGVGTLPFR